MAALGPILRNSGKGAFRLDRLKIGSRLTLCFILIILMMFSGDSILLWQFHLAQSQAKRLSSVDEELITVLQTHANLMSFYELFDVLSHSEDSNRLMREAESLRKNLLEDSRESRNALNRLPSEIPLDPALQAALETVQHSVPSQLDAITSLAQAGEWQAVRLRLDNEVRPLESRISALVDHLAREVRQARAQSVVNIEGAERRILFIVPMTATLTLFFAALLGLTITRSIAQPLGRLMEASKALGRGEFQQRVAVVGTDELAHLSRAFNEATGTLEDLYNRLHRREADLAEVQRLSHTGSFGWNVGTGELAWSDETFRIFEYHPAVKPTMEMVLTRVHPEDRSRVQKVLDRVAYDGTDWDFEYRLLMPDGSAKYIRTVAHAIHGSTRQFIGAVVDLTLAKQAEEALRQTQLTLAHVTRVTTLGELTASIAHEVNQPLAAAITNSNTCVRWLARNPPDLQEAREAAVRCSKSASRAAEIIKRIRVLFQKGASQRELVDVNEVIREMIVLLRNEADSRSVSIRLHLLPNLPTISADRVQLQQVLMNLMLNGIEAVSSAGTAGRLTISSQQFNTDQLLISVADTGVGLMPEHVDHIFDAFFTTKHDGTGLGLAISRSIIESHGGRLWATANSGVGATFSFTLPKEADARA